ncbi:MAG TPA: hypothetical protein VN256_09155 [Pyrinomonadaceae bacterium]|nr:hypothetical protein [Pyrinomonadaceae bacterium]
MSYHILQQFDEQWLADLKQETPGDARRSLLDSFEDDGPRALRARLASRESRRWAIVVAAILLATFALFFSIDASRRAESLQQRLDVLEKTAKK